MIKLSSENWDRHINGWHCSQLGHNNVRDIFCNGNKIDPSDYEVDRDDRVIYWKSRGYMPDEIVVNFAIEPNQNLFNRWQNFNFNIPITVAIITALGAIIAAGLPEMLKQQLGNKDYTKEKGNRETNIDSQKKLGNYVISLETITKEDGGSNAAIKQLYMKAESQGYEKNSVLLQYNDSYRVVLHFPTIALAENNLARAKSINKTVNGVQNLSTWCGSYQEIKKKIFKCSNDISK